MFFRFYSQAILLFEVKKEIKKMKEIFRFRSDLDIIMNYIWDSFVRFIHCNIIIITSFAIINKIIIIIIKQIFLKPVPWNRKI
jgi:hypothetical protein